MGALDVSKIVEALAQAAGVTKAEAGVILIHLRDSGFDIVPKTSK